MILPHLYFVTVVVLLQVCGGDCGEYRSADKLSRELTSLPQVKGVTSNE